MLAVKDTDQAKFNELQEQLTKEIVFNYLSELNSVRTTLYYVCLFARYETPEKQQLLHDNKDAFNKLFM